MYRYEATSVEGFIQQLAVAYLTHGYWFYVSGWIPPEKDCRAVDRKLIARYGMDVSKWTRARQKQRGEARVQYLRHGRFFVLLATHGKHPFFELEGKSIRDARRTPIRYRGYAVSHHGGHAHVRIDNRLYARLKTVLTSYALERDPARLIRALGRIPFEPYAPVRRQLFNVLRAMNRRRRTAGLACIPAGAIRLRRRVYAVYAGTRSAEHGYRPHMPKW